MSRGTPAMAQLEKHNQNLHLLSQVECGPVLVAAPEEPGNGTMERK